MNNQLRSACIVALFVFALPRPSIGNSPGDAANQYRQRAEQLLGTWVGHWTTDVVDATHYGGGGDAKTSRNPDAGAGRCNFQIQATYMLTLTSFDPGHQVVSGHFVSSFKSTIGRYMRGAEDRQNAEKFAAMCASDYHGSVGDLSASVAIRLQSGRKQRYGTDDEKCQGNCTVDTLFTSISCSSTSPLGLTVVHFTSYHRCPEFLSAAVWVRADGQLKYDSAYGNSEYIELLPDGNLTYTDASGFGVSLSKLAGPEQGLGVLVSRLVNTLEGADVTEEVERGSNRYATEYKFQNVRSDASHCNVDYDEVTADQKSRIVLPVHLFLSKPTAAGISLSSDDKEMRTLREAYRVAVGNAGEHFVLIFASRDAAESVAALINQSAALCKTRANALAHTSAGEQETKEQESAVALRALLSTERAGDNLMADGMLGRYSHAHVNSRGPYSDADEEFLTEADAKYCRAARKIWQDASDAITKSSDQSDVAIRLSKKLSGQTALTCGFGNTPLCVPNDESRAHLIRLDGTSLWGPVFPADCRITWQRLEQERTERR
jgi:hypothetical protein